MSEWKKVRLGDCCLIGDGSHASLKRQEKGILYITAKNLTSNGLDISKVDYISEELFNKHFKDNTNSITRPIRNDIIFSIIGSLGACYLVKDEKFGISSSVAIFRSKGEIIPLYLFYYLKSETLKSEINSIKGGVAQGFMSLSKLGSLSIYYPSSIKRQHRIATILSRYDDLIENYQRQIKLLEEAAQRLYKEWFVDFRFPGHESTKFVNGIPEGWEKKKIFELGKVITGKTPSTAIKANYGGNIPFITIPDMHSGIYPTSSQTLSKRGAESQSGKYIPENSLMVSCIGTAGLVCITETLCQTNQQINSLVLDNNSELYYMYFTFLSLKEHLNNIGSNGATMTNVNKSKFENIEVTIPIDSLIFTFNDITINIFNKIKNLSHQIRSLTEARDRLLPKLMNGEIEV